MRGQVWGLITMDEQHWDALFKKMNKPEISDADHLDGALLFDYLDDLLDPARERRVQEHLSACKACGDLLLEIQEPLPFDVDAPVPQEKSVAWQALIGADRPGSTVTPTARWTKPRIRHLAPWLVAAAALVLAGLSWLKGPAGSPQANIRIASLSPMTDLVRSGSESTLSNDLPLVLALAYVGRETITEFSLTIDRDSGETLWRHPVVRDADGMVVVSIPRGFLAEGAYTAVLSGDGAILARYPFRIRENP